MIKSNFNFFQHYSADNKIPYFRKGLSLKSIENLVKKMEKYNNKTPVTYDNFKLKCYFMQKPVPNITDGAAINDIKNAIDYLADITNNHNIAINMHINPTFVARGTPIEKEFLKGNYNPPFLTDVAKAVFHGKNKGISIFICLNDEKLAVKGGSFIRPGDKEIIKKLEQFNRTQNYDILKEYVDK